MHHHHSWPSHSICRCADKDMQVWRSRACSRHSSYVNRMMLLLYSSIHLAQAMTPLVFWQLGQVLWVSIDAQAALCARQLNLAGKGIQIGPWSKLWLRQSGRYQGLHTCNLPMGIEQTTSHACTSSSDIPRSSLCKHMHTFPSII